MTHPGVWFEVLGKDGDHLQRFYSDLFGWKITVDNPMKYGMVDAGAPGKGGIPGGVGTVMEGTRPSVTFYVQSSDLQKTLTQAEKLGGKQMMAPRNVGGDTTIALFQDPEGNVIGLVHGGAGQA